MRQFLLDTNIFIAYARNQQPLIQQIEQKLDISNPTNLTMLSVVTQAECMAFALKNHWGDSKKQALTRILNVCLVIDIHSSSTQLLQAYAEIDAFSAFKLAKKPASSGAIRMGKNDLWIAATAHLLQAELITTDGDFDHLDGHYLTLHRF